MPITIIGKKQMRKLKKEECWKCDHVSAGNCADCKKPTCSRPDGHSCPCECEQMDSGCEVCGAETETQTVRTREFGKIEVCVRCEHYGFVCVKCKLFGGCADDADEEGRCDSCR